MEQTFRQLRGMGHLLKPDPRKVKTPEQMLEHLAMVGRSVTVLHDDLEERMIIASEPDPETTPEPEREETEGRDRMSRGGRKRKKKKDEPEPELEGLGGTSD